MAEDAAELSAWAPRTASAAAMVDGENTLPGRFVDQARVVVVVHGGAYVASPAVSAFSRWHRCHFGDSLTQRHKLQSVDWPNALNGR